MTTDEIKQAIEALVGAAGAVTDQAALLKQVRALVYGDKGWDSPYRLDNFEVSRQGIRIAFSYRSQAALHVRKDFALKLHKAA